MSGPMEYSKEQRRDIWRQRNEVILKEVRAA